MSASTLRAFVPDSAAAPPEPFRSEDATVGQVLAWFRTNNPKQSRCVKAERERRRLYDLLDAAMGSRRCIDCRPFDLLAWINQNCTDNNWTRKRWNAALQSPFNLAAKLRLISMNPFKGLSFPEGSEGRDWTDAEYRALLRHSAPEFRRFLVFLRCSGARPGELKFMRKTDVRRHEKVIVLREHKTDDVTKGARRIVINTVIGKLLDFIGRESPKSAKHVLLNAFGRPWTDRALSKRMCRLRRDAGLGDDVKLHGGRHTYGTNAIMNDVPLPAVMELMGHKSIMTTKKYLHLANKIDHLKDAAEKAIRATKSSQEM